VAIGIASDIVSADQHGAIGVEQSSVQILGSSEFYHLPMRLKYSRYYGANATTARAQQCGINPTYMEAVV
jgi:hypothetical protein